MMTQSQNINIVDLAFIVDTTGSMGGLINSARSQMIAMIESLTGIADIQLRLGIVEYRDHPPQDKMVHQVYDFTANLNDAQNVLQELRVYGGGDEPEAVFDGIVAACRELTWHKQARRLAVLVGDAPPHGVGCGYDSFPGGCPCGETIESVTRLTEETQVTLHAISLSASANASFSTISALTGGTFFTAQQANVAIEHLATMLKSEFSNLDLDRKILALWQEDPDSSIDELSERTGVSRYAASASFVRLLSRDLIAVPSGK